MHGNVLRGMGHNSGGTGCLTSTSLPIPNYLHCQGMPLLVRDLT